jgi:hypothetical protein
MLIDGVALIDTGGQRIPLLKSADQPFFSKADCAQMEAIMRMYGERITTKRKHDIEAGLAEPKTKIEWAVWNQKQRRVNTAILKVLHRNAAIRMGALQAGKIVVIPPKGTK